MRWRLSLTGSTGQLIAVHNFAADAQTATVWPESPDAVTHVIDLLGTEQITLVDGKLEVNLDGYGFMWLRIVRTGEKHLL